MFEARLNQGDLLKRLIESIKDLVTDANFDCSAAGLSMQGMDASHISLVELLLRADGFEHYRCDRGLSMGMHVGNLAKMLKVRVPIYCSPLPGRTRLGRSVLGFAWDARYRQLPSHSMPRPPGISGDSTPSTPLLSLQMPGQQ